MTSYVTRRWRVGRSRRIARDRLSGSEYERARRVAGLIAVRRSASGLEAGLDVELDLELLRYQHTTVFESDVPCQVPVPPLDLTDGTETRFDVAVGIGGGAFEM